MVQRLEKGCHNLDHLVLQWESHFPATKQQFHSNPRFNKSYFVYLRSIHDSWHECMILISELGDNLRYEIYFEMRSELRTPPCWNAFSQCKMVWWLFERNSTLPNSGAACFCSFLPCLGYQEWEQKQQRETNTERPAGREIFWGEVYPGVNLRSVKMTENIALNIAKITHSYWWPGGGNVGKAEAIFDTQVGLGQIQSWNFCVAWKTLGTNQPRPPLTEEIPWVRCNFGIFQGGDIPEIFQWRRPWALSIDIALSAPESTRWWVEKSKLLQKELLGSFQLDIGKHFNVF